MTAVMTLEASPKRKGNPNWVKGVSGNPSGRSRSLSELRQKLLKLEPFARKRLLKLINSENEDMALKAIALWAAYAMGKPAEAMDLAKLDAMADRMRSVVAEVVRKELPEPVTEAQLPPAGAKPPEAADVSPVQVDAPSVSVSPVSLQSGAAHCLYRLSSGPCETQPLDGEQWCAAHKAKLFGMLTAK